MIEQRTLIPLALFVIALAYTGLLVVAILGGGAVEAGRNPYLLLVDVLILAVGFLVASGLAYAHVMRLFTRYSADFHDLTDEDAEALVVRLLFGPQLFPPRFPILRVQSGQADLQGAPVIFKVGGPASLSVDQDNVVVTSRLGRLYRVLGPGFYDLGAFERVWDVVDLRPQRRTLVVEFMTRDGIPAACQASLVCRAAVPRDFKPVGPRKPAAGSVEETARDVVLKLTTSKYVRRPEGPDRVSDWVTGIANGALDGIVRDELEQYGLDQLVNPMYWLKSTEQQQDNGVNAGMAPPETLPQVEARARAKLVEEAAKRGIIIDSVELASVQPSEEAVSHQWLEFWQAKLQQEVDADAIRAEAAQAEKLSETRAIAQARFIEGVIKQVNAIRSGGGSAPVPSAMVVESVLEVLWSMYAWEPDAHRSLFQQGESLMRFVDMVLYGPSRVPPYLSPTVGPGLPGQRPDSPSPGSGGHRRQS